MKSAPSSPKLRLVHRNPGDGVEVAPAPRMDDTRLLAALRAGDVSAATAFYERSRPIVDRTVRRLLGRPDQDQQDISQQVMVEIVRSIDRYRGECPFDAWISTVAAHVVYKRLRQRKMERRVLAVETLPVDVEAADQPARSTLLRSIVERVSQHLRQIESRRAWAFVLHEVHGYDLREMAQIMGTSLAAAQSRLVRGRKELHQRIAADPELADALVRREGSP